MALDIDFVVALAKILDKGTFDEELFNRFIETKGARGFIDHENTMGRKVDKRDIREELVRLIENDGYKDKYFFYQIKNHLKELKNDIEYLIKNNKLVIDLALKRVYEIVPEEVKIVTNIYLYTGGIDGGFTINRKYVFINYGNYIGEREEFIKILSHELYHSRYVTYKHRAKFILKSISKKNRHPYSILGKIIEEGIACLIQHGTFLKKDDPTGSLTRRNLSLSRKQFNLLNEILLDIKYERPFNKKIKELNIYLIGYIIVSTVYNEEGVLILDNWTLNLNFKEIIKKYMELCLRDNILPALSSESIGWLIN